MNTTIFSADLPQWGLLQEGAANPDLLEVNAQVTYAAMLQAPDTFGLHIDDLRYLYGPAVLHPGGWGIGVLRKMILPARIAILENGEKNLCSYVEALAYLSTASMVAPLIYDHAQVMFWLFQEIFGTPENNAHEKLGFTKPIALTEYQEKYILDDLRRDIRRSVVKNAKAKGMWK